MILQRYIALRRAKQELTDFEDLFWGGTDLRQLYSELSEEAVEVSGIERIFVAGFHEYERMNAEGSVDADAVQTSVTRATRVAVTREEELLEDASRFSRVGWFGQPVRWLTRHCNRFDLPVCRIRTYESGDPCLISARNF